MCWVTLDRALRLAEKRSLPAPFSTWFAVRDEIYRDIHEHFWNEKLQTFVQTPGSDTLDAAVLMMPLVRFIGPTDPRFLGTLDAIGRDLRVDPLIFRYTRGPYSMGCQVLEAVSAHVRSGTPRRSRERGVSMKGGSYLTRCLNMRTTLDCFRSRSPRRARR